METTIWICTGIICFVIIVSLADIIKLLGQIKTLLDEIFRIVKYTSKM